MAMKYNGNRFIPSPIVNLSKAYQTSNDGTQVGTLFNIVIEGKFLYNKGSPSSSGTFWNVAGYPTDENLSDVNDWMSAIIKKQEAVRRVFADEGKNFIVEGWNGGNYLECNPRVKSIEFPRGNPTSWANIADYRITLEADKIYLNGQSYTEETGAIVSGFKIETANEDWILEVQDENLQLFRLSHQIEAKGKRFYSTSGTVDRAAWQNAQDYVLTRLGLNYDRLYASGVLNNTGVSGYNYWRNQTINELGGGFAVRETWLCYAAGSGAPATEESEVNVRYTAEGVTDVTVQGKIQGLEQRTNNADRTIISSKYNNAWAKFLNVYNGFLARASGYAQVTLNPIPVNYTIGHNQIAGTVTYNYNYNNRPATTISNALVESITVGYDYATDIFAELAVLGREAGPVIQSIQTVGAKTKTITVEAIMPAKTYTTSTIKPDTNSLISGLAPSATFVVKPQDREVWDENKGRYSRTVAWRYTN